MSFEKAMREEFMEIPGLLNKVRPFNAPEQTPSPYLVYIPSEGVNHKELGGYLDTKTITYELNLIGLTFAILDPIVEGVIAKLKSFEQRTIGTNFPVFVQEVTYEAPVGMYEFELKQHRYNIEFTVTI
jgi:hypothetical protein